MPPIRKRKFYGVNKFRFSDSDWCGPGWSDGKWQSNRCGYATSRNRWDQVCKEHDCDLASGMDEATADLKFARNINNPFVGYAPYAFHKINNMFTPNWSNRGAPSKARSLDYNGSSSGIGYSKQGYQSSIMNVNKHQKVTQNGSRKTVKLYNEYGGVVEETSEVGEPISQVLYVGHSTYIREQMALSIWCSIIKKLLEKCNYDVPSLDATLIPLPTSPFSVRVKYQTSENLGFSNFDSISAGNVLDLAQSCVDNFTSNVQYWFKEIQLTTTGLDLNGVQAGTMSLERCVIKMFVKSKMMIQNTTPSASGSDQLDVLGTNPLKFRKYVIKRPNFEIASFHSQDDPLFGANDVGKPSLSSGLIAFYNNLGFTPNQARYLAEAPRPQMINECNGVTNGVLQPGCFLHNDVIYKTSLYLKTFYAGSDNPVTKTLSEYGKCEVFAFDKFLDSRAEATAPSINYQIQYTVITSLTFKKTAPTAAYKTVQIESYAA